MIEGDLIDALVDTLIMQDEEEEQRNLVAWCSEHPFLEGTSPSVRLRVIRRAQQRVMMAIGNAERWLKPLNEQMPDLFRRTLHSMHSLYEIKDPREAHREPIVDLAYEYLIVVNDRFWITQVLRTMSFTDLDEVAEEADNILTLRRALRRFIFVLEPYPAAGAQKF